MFLYINVHLSMQVLSESKRSLVVPFAFAARRRVNAQEFRRSVEQKSVNGEAATTSFVIKLEACFSAQRQNPKQKQQQ